nr:integrase, catalytic region, zinc finger, CCHC-type, peptidase aspartic, catalytic [Tanacetum cinerariifolium]
MCVLKSVDKPLKETIALESNNKSRNFTRKLYEHVSKTCSWWYPKFTPLGYIWKPKSKIENVNPNVSMPLGKASRTDNLIEIVLFIIDSGCSKHMTGNLKLLINFMEKFLGTVKFGNDQIAPIIGYGDLVQGAVTITRVYYVEGLNHNLFSVGQFCDADLEVAFRKSTCFIRDLKGNDLLTGSRRTDLYSIILQDTNSPNPICLMAKATNVNPNLIKIVLFIIDSGCSKHMTRNLKLLINFVEKFLGTVKFGNDQIVPILGYGDLVQGAITIKRVYYVEGLNHNLFSVGQFCDADLEVAFRKSTCFIRDFKGNDLLTSSRGTDLYSITLQNTNSPNPICLMAKATSSQAWLWHRRLSHLNVDTINLLSKNDIVVGLLKLKFIKDHLCSSKLKEIMNRVGSIEPFENPLDIRKLESSSYHALGACLSPYNAFLKRVISSSDDKALDKEDTSKQKRIDDIDADEDIALVSTHDDVSTQDNIVQDEGIEDVGEKEVVEVVTTAKMIIDAVVFAAQGTTAIDDISVSTAETIVTTAPTIIAESTKINVKVTQAPKRKRVMIQEPEEQQQQQKQLLHNNLKFRTKRIGLPEKKLNKLKRLNLAWDDVQAKIKADNQLAQRLQAKEQEQLADAEKAKLNKSFVEIQELFHKAMKRINTFVDFRTELVEESPKKDEAETTQVSSSKRRGDDLEQERYKKQKMENDKESAELKKCLEIVLDDGDERLDLGCNSSVPSMYGVQFQMKWVPQSLIRALGIPKWQNSFFRKIVMENPNHLNEPDEAILEVNPVVPEPNQVADIHDPNEMVDIPDDIDLVDYDKEEPEEDHEEEPEEDVDIELKDVGRGGHVAPEATARTITQKPYAIRDFPRGLFEVGESSSARDSSNIDGLALWALRRDLEVLALKSQTRMSTV